MLTGEGAHYAVVAAENLTVVDLSEVPTGAAALVEVRWKAMLVVSICMPWRFGAPALPPDAAPGATTGPQEWAAVLAGLDRGLRRLSRELPDVPLLLGGDFNQTLSGYVVGSHEGRARLERLLSEHRLIAYTSTLPSARSGSAAIDQICGQPDAVATGWWAAPAVANRTKPATDHAGYWVDVPPP